ncbi:1, 4-beta cellobiohydrolase [Cercophora newfieldiana]|uniref:Glucanase n=1 Tax=Cercophora newfieldiana TaxID=92897 RepID=A0AA39XUP6_9PEZI|nr:1, 4-beta cellobiohydrolase [Cercophora newfieldiana]
MKLNTIRLVALTGCYAIGISLASDANLDSKAPVVPVAPSSATLPGKERQLHGNPVYAKLVGAAVERMRERARLDEGEGGDMLWRKAERVKDVGSFYWIRVIRDVPCDHIVGVVLEGLQGQGRGSCAAPGFSLPRLEDYKRNYVDPLAKLINAANTTAFAIVIEPGFFSNMIATFTTVQACGANVTRQSYRENVAYALRTLSLPNVVLYNDAGHGGTVGWQTNLKAAADELFGVYEAAGRPEQVRGIAVNTGGWNSWDLSPGEFETTRETPVNRAQNEKRFVQLLGNLLKQSSTPYHAVMDTSRNGVQGLRAHWTDWCNLNGAGFGRFPSAQGTGLDDFADAFIWAKGGGISDGTSDAASLNFEVNCGQEWVFEPSPEKGEWNQAYFEMLLENARPSIKV